MDNNYQIFFPASSSSHNSLPTTPMDHQFQEESSVKKTSSGSMKSEKKIRKGRFAFETRSQVDVLDDGYRWRKYGQKAVKNDKFPRFIIYSSFVFSFSKSFLYIYIHSMFFPPLNSRRLTYLNDSKFNERS